MSPEEVENTIWQAVRQIEESEDAYAREAFLPASERKSRLEKAKEFIIDVQEKPSGYKWSDLVKNLNALGVIDSNGAGSFRFSFDSDGNIVSNVMKQKRMHLHKPHGTGEGLKLYNILVKNFLLPRLTERGVCVYDATTRTYKVADSYAKTITSSSKSKE